MVGLAPRPGKANTTGEVKRESGLGANHPGKNASI